MDRTHTPPLAGLSAPSAPLGPAPPGTDIYDDFTDPFFDEPVAPATGRDGDEMRTGPLLDVVAATLVACGTYERIPPEEMAFVTRNTRVLEARAYMTSARAEDRVVIPEALVRRMRASGFVASHVRSVRVDAVGGASYHLMRCAVVRLSRESAPRLAILLNVAFVAPRPAQQAEAAALAAAWAARPRLEFLPPTPAETMDVVTAISERLRTLAAARDEMRQLLAQPGVVYNFFFELADVTAEDDALTL